VLFEVCLLLKHSCCGCVGKCRWLGLPQPAARGFQGDLDDTHVSGCAGTWVCCVLCLYDVSMCYECCAVEGVFVANFAATLKVAWASAVSLCFERCAVWHMFAIGLAVDASNGTRMRMRWLVCDVETCRTAMCCPH
jgi:hypothetical protein